MANPAGKTSSSPQHASEAPDSAVLDLEHLDHHTFNDSHLRDELLAMFAHQVAEQLALLSACNDHAEWLVATHTMKGSARAVGAWTICKVAENLEALPEISWREEKTAGLERLSEAIKDCLAAIDALTAV